MTDLHKKNPEKLKQFQEGVYFALKYDCEKTTKDKHLEKDGISINTWHIIDPESLFSLQLGITDRKLKYDMNEFLTYSKENPLLNTAYKIKYIQKAYKKAGLKIEEIIHGSWRGNKTNQFKIESIKKIHL